MKKQKLGLGFIGLLGAALASAPSAHAGGEQFLELCRNPNLPEEVAITVKGLRTLANKFGEPVSCEIAVKILKGMRTLKMPGRTFDRIDTADLSPIATLDWIENLEIPGQIRSKDLSPLTTLKLKSLRLERSGAIDLSPLLKIPTLQKIGVTLRSEADQKILAQLPNLKTLILDAGADSLDLTVVGQNLAIRELQLNPAFELSPPTKGLSAFKNLERLSMAYGELDLSELKALPLKSLRLSLTKVSALDSLSQVTTLEELILQRMGLTSVKFVETLANLKTLSMMENELTDIWSITALSNLEVLDLYNNKIKESMAVSQLKNLKTVNLGGNPLYGSFYFNYLEKLERLDLSSSHVYALGLLPGLQYPKLKMLILNNTDIRSSGSENINGTNFPNLTDINVSNTQISYVDSFATLLNLEVFEANSNFIQDVSPFSKATKLKALRVRENYIRAPYVCPVQPESVCDFQHQKT